VATSTHLSISIDGTSDVRERNPISIHLAGVQNVCPWSFPFHFCEPGDHKAATQLQEIKKMLHDVNFFNEGKDLKRVSVVDIEAIVFDTTSSNTGKKKGLAALLKRAREEEWQTQGGVGPVPELIVKGCEDHILNLMSKDMEKYLVTTSIPSLVIGEKHHATDLVQLLIDKIRKRKQSFRHYMEKNFEITKSNIPRISDTRFVDLHFLFIIYF